jgi:hypothetical protein
LTKLFYTSSYIDSKKFTDLEDLFSYIEPSEMILIFDTNVVIGYRQYFFNPTQFTQNHDTKEYLKSMRNLVKKIEKFNLEVNASFGVEESCRELYDFSINSKKLEQTRTTVKRMLHEGISDFDNHLTTRQYFGEEIKLKTEFPSSKLECLMQESTFQHLLIVSYISMLKVVELHYLLQAGIIKKLEAYKTFVEFMRSELDVLSGMHTHYAAHLFGGALNYSELWKKKKAKNNEKKLHNIFNASIDVICPVIAGKTQQIYDKIGSKKLIPVFVSGDKLLSDLHSRRNIKVIFEENPSLVQKNFTSEFVFHDYHLEILNWTEEEYKSIQEINDNANRPSNVLINEPKKAIQFLPLVKELENKALNLMK